VRRTAALTSAAVDMPTRDTNIAAERILARTMAPLPLTRLVLTVVHHGDGLMGAIER
jgi:hypothetical protein